MTYNPGTEITQVEGSTILELLRNETVQAQFAIYRDGSVYLEFKAPKFATEIIREVIRNQLVYLTMGFAAAGSDGGVSENGTDGARLSRAKKALVDTGYFTEDEVGDDIAPRIYEMKAKIDEIDRNARAYGWEVAKGNFVGDASIVMSPDNPFVDENWRDRSTFQDGTDEDRPPTAPKEDA